jgi:RNA polymerase sigma-70 factor, ECF subfamily
MDRRLTSWFDVSELSESRPQEAVARGLTEQVTAYFLTYRSSICRYVRHGCGSADAEEVTQEAFLRLYLALERGEQIESVVRWLFRVARNLVIDRGRSRSARYVKPVLHTVWQQLAETVPCQQPTCEDVLVDESRLVELQMALSCLTDVQRQCLHLRWEGLLYREIAEVLDMSVPGVADAVQRAVSKLRHKLGTDRVAHE